MPSLNLLCHSKTDARFKKDGRKTVWRIPYVSVGFFSSLKQNFIAYRSSKVSSCPDCIFEIRQLWQSNFSRVYSNSCCRCLFEAEIIQIGQSSHKMYSNNIVNFQESTKSLETYWMHHIHIKLNVSEQMSDVKCLLSHTNISNYLNLCKQMINSKQNDSYEDRNTWNHLTLYKKLHRLI